MAKKAETKPKVVKVAEKLDVSTILLSGGKEYKYETKTVEEALELLKPETVKGRGILTCEFAGTTRQIVLYPLKLKRLIRNPANKRFVAKQLNVALGIKTLEQYI